MTITTKRSLIALLLSLVLVVSLFTVSVFASDASTTETKSETTEATSGSETESGSENEAETENKEQAALNAVIAQTKKTLIINSIIIGVIVLIIVAVIIKFRKKLGDFMRSVKSELKKIVWSSKEQTRKGFLVVVIIAVIFAVMLGLVDYAFNTGISMLASLFN